MTWQVCAIIGAIMLLLAMLRTYLREERRQLREFRRDLEQAQRRLAMGNRAEVWHGHPVNPTLKGGRWVLDDGTEVGRLRDGRH